MHLKGKDLLKKLEIIVKFPEVAIYFININGGFLLSSKKHDILKKLKKKIYE
jgi:hypothetical protein